MGCCCTVSKQLNHRLEMGMEAAIFNGIAVSKHRPHLVDA